MTWLPHLALLSCFAAPGNALDLSSLERQLIALMAPTSTNTTALLYDFLGQARTAAAAAICESDTATASGAAAHPGTGRPMLFAPPPQVRHRDSIRCNDLQVTKRRRPVWL